MFNSWESKVWFFSDLNHFFDFAYSHEMFDYIGRGECEEYDFEDDTEQSEIYQNLLALKNTIWTSETCEKFIKKFDHSSFELVQFGKVIDLINISDENFEKCKELYLTKDQLENVALKEGSYQIISEYIRRQNKKPRDSKEEFIDFLNNW